MLKNRDDIEKKKGFEKKKAINYPFFFYFYLFRFVYFIYLLFYYYLVSIYLWQKKSVNKLYFYTGLNMQIHSNWNFYFNLWSFHLFFFPLLSWHYFLLIRAAVVIFKGLSVYTKYICSNDECVIKIQQNTLHLNYPFNIIITIIFYLFFTIQFLPFFFWICRSVLIYCITFNFSHFIYSCVPFANNQQYTIKSIYIVKAHIK